MDKTCAVDGCGRPALARGWCSPHWQRWRRHGNPLGGSNRASDGEPGAFLLAHVDDPHSDGDPCVLWPYATHLGYGWVNLDGRSRYAHVALLTLRDGPRPDSSMEACHGPCHDRRCIVHVRWGTHAENMGDMVRHGTAARGEGHGWSKLTERDVRDIRVMLEDGVRQETVAAWFGVSTTTIFNISVGKIWGWLS